MGFLFPFRKKNLAKIKSDNNIYFFSTEKKMEAEKWLFFGGPVPNEQLELVFRRAVEDS